ncbi:DUF397 domain-containing protein [Streptomyces sp. NPDC051561]|uniref:DUF397 domain-containing protein n=1 Tax=Streptomyces sp. NPDC051561 TaxID=3365658 RepID=UPI0037B1B104
MKSTHAGTLSGADWFRSSYSDNQGGDCVEGAHLAHGTLMAVRDCKVPNGPAFVVHADTWAAFIDGVRTETAHS